jgi:hypothetical protein
LKPAIALRGVAALTVTLSLAVACATADEPPAAGSRTGEPGASSTGEPQPYPYTTPTPAAEVTVVDGTYMRHVGPDVVGGAGKCVRCPPYRLALAEDTLELEKGEFRVSQEGAGYLAVGHYTVSGDRITFFNDPNCSAERGTYSWSLEEQVLQLEVVDDDCAFGDVRVRYFTAGPWTRGTEGA